MKKIALSLLVVHALYGVSNEELLNKINALQSELQIMKVEQEEQNNAMLEEISNSQSGTTSPLYESYSSMGPAASKVYSSSDSVSLGGYGEYAFTKYTNFKNYDSQSANEQRRKSEFNIVRFIPYIGFKFSDWIVMNTEIEFEDGGARSDNTKNYKYAIVEFSYLDFLIDETFALRVGHILVPFGLTNLNHEPIAYLTTSKPAVETAIIPSTWHTNGLLAHGEIAGAQYYLGAVTSPDASGFGKKEGVFIQQGRTGAKQTTDDFSFVSRLAYSPINGVDSGVSLLYGTSTPLQENATATVSIKMAEVHISYRAHGFDIKALATYGAMSGDLSQLPTASDVTIAQSVNGEYITLGYNMLHSFNTIHKLYLVGELERLNMDATEKTTNPDNNRYFEYTTGMAYFPDPKVVIKADFKIKDYAQKSNFADESVVSATAGFIF